MGRVGHWWLLSSWPTPRLALTASFVLFTPCLPRSLLLKPSDCAGLGQSLGPSPGRGCSASAELGFVPLPATAGTSRAIPPWCRVPRLGARLGGCVGRNSPQPGGCSCPKAPELPSVPCVPPSCGVSRTPGSSSSPPGHPQLRRARARCVQLWLGHEASPNPCCPGPCPAPCGHHGEKQGGQGGDRPWGHLGDIATCTPSLSMQGLTREALSHMTLGWDKAPSPLLHV